MNRKILQKTISILLNLTLLWGMVLPFLQNVHAQEIVITPPPQPVITAPPDPTITRPPEPTVTRPPEPTVTQPPEPTVTASVTLTPTPSPEPTGISGTTGPTGDSGTSGSSGAAGDTSQGASGATGPTGTESTPVQGTSTGGQQTNGQSGSTEITSGTANTSVSMTSTANQNTSAAVSSSPGGTSVQNSGNGAGSANTSTATDASGQVQNQQNSASVANGLTASANSGNNDALKNMGDVAITSGDANVSGTMVTAVNTNIAGVSVAEFNVNDNQNGDIILDFSAGCISGCGTGNAVSANNTGNGSESVNTATAGTLSNDSTFQSNDAVIGSDMTLAANSGSNTAYKNTGGDTSIQTGDANVSASALTFANNNISGNVIYGVVNIYGELHGDIIFPEEALTGCCTASSGLAAENSGNGSDSVNTATANSQSQSATNQNNAASINNNLTLETNTGDNDLSKNTGGQNTVTTGDANVNAQVLNVANTNVDGGVWWLVLVNEAGNWIGRIIGAPEGGSMAASAGTEFTVGQNGEITASNNGNGSGSQNQASAQTNQNTNTEQSNTATVNNTLNLSATTGKNTASQNTGGDTAVTTGDATIIANLVNFVNNNITGGGKVVVTVVNVFGKWFGDFVTPGQKKADKPESVQTDSQTTQSEPTLHTQESAYTTQTVTETQNESASQATATVFRRRIVNVLGLSSTVKRLTDTQRVQMGNTITEPQNDDALAYRMTTSPSLVKGEKVVRVNMAMILLLLPFIIAIPVIRKLIRKRNTTEIEFI